MTSELSPYIKASTIDDLIRGSFDLVLKYGINIKASKGAAIEVSGVCLELSNPRARLSQSVARGKIVSALGELCWYLSGNDSGRIMDYYIRNYSRDNADEPDSESCRINGAYGPRIFGERPNQFEVIEDILRRKPSSRQAVIQVFDSKDVRETHRDVPCTCTLQFMLREGVLNLIVHMRSNDVYLGLPHDIFCFTMMQEIMANRLGVGLGAYKHFVGSFHLYEANLNEAKDLLSEGWYSRSVSMPPMPQDDMAQGMASLLKYESEIRLEGKVDQGLSEVNPYWSDLIKILQAYRADVDGDQTRLKEIMESVNAPFYKPYFVQRLRG